MEVYSAISVILAVLWVQDTRCELVSVVISDIVADVVVANECVPLLVCTTRLGCDGPCLIVEVSNLRVDRSEEELAYVNRVNARKFVDIVVSELNLVLLECAEESVAPCSRSA